MLLVYTTNPKYTHIDYGICNKITIKASNQAYVRASNLRNKLYKLLGKNSKLYKLYIRN